VADGQNLEGVERSLWSVTAVSASSAVSSPPRRGLLEGEGEGLGGGQGGAVAVFGFEPVAAERGADRGDECVVFAVERG